MKKSILPTNKAPARVIHIDLNSCFATIEKQANRLLRDRPVAVAAYDTPRGFIVASCYQAKAKGIKLGVNVREARALCPGIVIVTPDPAKYREAHKRFKEILLNYTSDVTAKSIDEFVLHLEGSPALRAGKSMEVISLEAKQRIYEVLGEAVTVNVGIGPNRFLAKFAAGFDKPNGMKRIDHNNLEQTYDSVDLLDLPGINTRYKARLQSYGIHTPLDFLRADRRVLEKVVFKSIVGYYWYLRLRGYEVDKYESKRGQVGHQYALPRKTKDRDELARLLMKLCEKVGRRLRRIGMTAGGIHLYLSFVNYQEAMHRDNGFIGGENMSSGNSWHHGEKTGYRLYSTESIYRAAKRLLAQADIWAEVRGMSITTFGLEPVDPEQISLFGTEDARTKMQDVREWHSFRAERQISDAVDEINNRYGEFVITPAAMMDMHGEILDRIAFGSVRDV